MALLSSFLLKTLPVAPTGGGATVPTIHNPLFRQTVQTSMQADSALDATLFGSLFGPQASFQMGGLPRMVGAQAVAGFVGGFFQSVQSIEHRLLEVWELADTLIYRAEATFTKSDGRQLTAPYVNVLKFDHNALSQYQVFIDLSPLR